MSKPLTLKKLNKCKENHLENLSKTTPEQRTFYFWERFFSKSNSEIRKIVLGVHTCNFSEFEPISTYKEELDRYFHAVSENERMKLEMKENELAALNQDIEAYKRNNSDDLEKIALDHSTTKNDILNIQYWTDFEKIAAEYNVIIPNKNIFLEKIANSIIEQLNAAVNLHLAIYVFPYLTNMLAHHYIQSIDYVDSGFDLSEQPKPTTKRHTKQLYETIGDVLENNYESYTEATYCSGYGFRVPLIEDDFQREFDHFIHKFIMSIFKSLISDSFELDPEICEELVEEISQDNFFCEITNLFDWSYFELVKQVSIYDLFHLYNDPSCLEDYKIFIKNT